MRPTSSFMATDPPRRNYHQTTIIFNQAKDELKHSPKLEELFQKIIYLDMVEIHLLTELINEKLGVKISDAEKERIARGDTGEGGAKSDEAKEEVKEEQTAFDLKLTGFDAKAKIKVIKEVRAITGLGLKEAKELVEGVPSAIKKGIKKEEAEELKAKLEEVGAQIEIS
jgi:large subunit ribosomal protein L7/L12